MVRHPHPRETMSLSTPASLCLLTPLPLKRGHRNATLPRTSATLRYAMKLWLRVDVAISPLMSPTWVSWAGKNSLPRGREKENIGRVIPPSHTRPSSACVVRSFTGSLQSTPPPFSCDDRFTFVIGNPLRMWRTSLQARCLQKSKMVKTLSPPETTATINPRWEPRSVHWR